MCVPLMLSRIYHVKKKMLSLEEELASMEERGSGYKRDLKAFHVVYTTLQAENVTLASTLAQVLAHDLLSSTTYVFVRAVVCGFVLDLRLYSSVGV